LNALKAGKKCKGLGNIEIRTKASHPTLENYDVLNKMIANDSNSKTSKGKDKICLRFKKSQLNSMSLQSDGFSPVL